MSKLSDQVCGLVAVAPTSADDYRDAEYENILTPTMIVRGENDRGLGMFAANLLVHIPTSTSVQVR